MMCRPQSAASFDQLFQFLAGAKLVHTIDPHPMNIPGSAVGPVTGGNLSVLYSLSGTPFEPDYEGKILFLEDLDEYLYHIDRMLLNFEHRGIFEKINGLVVGGFSEMHDNDVPFGKSAYEIIADKASKYGLPTLFGFPSGHKKDNFPLIFERFSTLTVEKHSCELDIG